MLYYLMIYLCIINLYGFFLMFYDKSKAKHHKWRISENMLFLVALCFGSLGILLGMYTFRHKTKHLKFIVFIPIILILQLILIFRLLKFNL
jgi:Predicted membrane protein